MIFPYVQLDSAMVPHMNLSICLPFAICAAQILAADPASSELLSELLLPHLRSYLVEDDQQLPPLLLHKCAQLQVQHQHAPTHFPLPFQLLLLPYSHTQSAIFGATKLHPKPAAAVPPGQLHQKCF